MSRALRIRDNSFKIPTIYNRLNIRLGNGATSDNPGGMTLTFWVRPMKTIYPQGEDGVRLVDISKPHEVWPMSEWGYFWVNYGSGWTNQEKSRPSFQGFSWTNMSTGYNNSAAREKFVDTDPVRLDAGSWYHIAVSIGYDLNTKLYVNGTLVSSRPASATRSTVFDSSYDLNISRFAKFGSALDGFIDEVRVYNRQLADNEIEATKMHLTNHASEQGLKAYFDFETDPDSEGNFSTPVGSVQGSLQNLDWRAEGDVVWEKVSQVAFGPSTGWIEGQSYPVQTVASWEAERAQIVPDGASTATAGSAKISWSKAGVYPVTLKLANPWGEETKTFNMITVQSGSSVDTAEVIDLTVFPNPFVEDVRVRFADAGIYKLTVYDLAGTPISMQMVDATAGVVASLNLNVPSGIYLLRVPDEQGKTLRTLKLQKR